MGVPLIIVSGSPWNSKLILYVPDGSPTESLQGILEALSAARKLEENPEDGNGDTIVNVGPTIVDTTSVPVQPSAPTASRINLSLVRGQFPIEYPNNPLSERFLAPHESMVVNSCRVFIRLNPKYMYDKDKDYKTSWREYGWYCPHNATTKMIENVSR